MLTIEGANVDTVLSLYDMTYRKKLIGDKDGDLSLLYFFPHIVLQLIHSLVQQNIKRKLWPDPYKLGLEEFCKGLVFLMQTSIVIWYSVRMYFCNCK